jgi:peptide/nickel transport system substrate-binding protein
VGLSSTAASAAAKLKSGGTVTFGGIAGVVSLNPSITTGNSTAGLNELEALYGILMRYDTKSKQFVPDMAQSLSHNADYTVWTLKLRPDVTFTDGTPYNAEAVIQNLTAQKQPVSLTANQFTLLTSMTATNDSTVVFHYAESFPELPFVLAQKNGAIAAPSYLAKVAAGQTTATPIGAGPFMVSSFQPGVGISLVRNPHYFAGPPYLDGLKFTYIPGGPATYQAFQTGQLQAAELIDYPSAAQAKQAGVSEYVELQPGGNTFNVNQLAGQPFSDQGLRQAVESAIDANLQTINTGLWQGTGAMSPYLFAPGTPFYSKVPVPKMTMDQEKAAVTAAESSLHWDGTLRLLCSNAPSSANEPTALEAILRPLGLNFTVSLAATAQEINILNVTHQYDIACFGQGIGAYFPFLTFSQFVQSAAAGPRYGYNNPQMDALIDKMRTETTQAATTATMKQIQALWFQTVPFIPIAPGNDTIITASNLHGVTHSSQAASFFDKAWLS